MRIIDGRYWKKVSSIVFAFVLACAMMAQTAAAQITVGTNGSDLMQDSIAKLKLKFALYVQDDAYLQNFWNNVDMDRVDADLREMKRKGYNGVSVQLNFGDIISSVDMTNETYTENSANELKFQNFVQKADSLGLYTIVWLNIANIPSGWGDTGEGFGSGHGNAGAQRPEAIDEYGYYHEPYYGYVAPGLQASAYDFSSSVSPFKWNVFKAFVQKAADLTNDDPSVIWDPLDWQYLNISPWDWGGDEMLTDWRDYLKQTNTSASYWQQRWGETQTGDWNDVLLPVGDSLISTLHSSSYALDPTDPLQIYAQANVVSIPLTAVKWQDFRAYNDAGMNKMIGDITSVLKAASPSSAIGQRIDYWRYGDYRASTWGTGQVDFYFWGYYPNSNADIDQAATVFGNQINNIRNRAAQVGRSKPIVAWETTENYNSLYGTWRGQSYKEAKADLLMQNLTPYLDSANLAGIGYWIYRDFPMTAAQMVGLNSFTGRQKPAQRTLTEYASRVNDNWSFEQATNGLPDLWPTSWCNGTCTGAYAAQHSELPSFPGDSTPVAHQLRLYSGTAAASDKQFILSDPIAVLPNARYQIRAWMRYALSGGGNASVRIIQYDKNGTNLNETVRAYTDGGWTWHENVVPFETLPNASYIKIRLAVGGELQAMLDADDVRMKATGLHLSFDDGSFDNEDGEQPLSTSANLQTDGGIKGAALRVGGSTQLNYGQSGHFDPTAGTLEAFIAPDWDADPTGNGSDRTIFSWTYDANNHFRLYADGQQSLIANWTSNGAAHSASYALNWKAGVWHHIATTWDDDSQTIELYVDGILQSQATGWQPPVSSPETPTSSAIHIGHEAGNDSFGGKMDEFHIYDYVRNASQIAGTARSYPSFWLSFMNDWDGYDGQAPDDNQNVVLFATGRAGGKRAAAFTGKSTHPSTLTYSGEGIFNLPEGSAEAWVKTDKPYVPAPSGSIPEQYIVNWNSLASGQSFGLLLTDQNRFTAQWNLGGTTYEVDSGNYLSTTGLGQYHFVAATWSKETQLLTLYVDGQKMGDVSLAGTMADEDGKVDIGSLNHAASWWEGQIDDIKIFNYKRTDSEILQDYQGHL